ncbi:MAG: CoB--CoM heterodisulfide reductase iron-sulfur subunit B family protein [Syntrophomonadaceae bacterium]|jgi:heterodisulfide reductase subunit B|nr:CoB--CoM heterodisulfide reductase iron-sulfur subunit B family protein [Syntrophomonadaceae bacterium]
MKYAYYPGCSLESMAQGYNLSTMAVFRILGIELADIDDWSCCGATSAHSTNDFLAEALPLRNLILAEKQGHDIIAPCAACYNLLKSVDHLIKSDESNGQHLNSKMQEIMGQVYHGTIRVRHVLEVLYASEAMKLIKGKIKNPLTGLKPALYYGCLLTRPPKVVSFEENPEQPVIMDRLMSVLGAEPVSWSHKTDCCGASLSISRTELVVKLCGEIANSARRAGANSLVVACPLCFTNLDMRQEAGGLPVFFITELVGLAMGLPDSRQWLNKHIVDPLPLVKALNLLSGS